jgi:hypothetical protein
MKHLADLSDPIVDIDLGTSQAQRRLTAHGNQMLTLTTIETSVCDIVHLVGIAAVQHLVHKTLIVVGIVARTELFKPIPMIDKDLFEDVPVPRRLSDHTE